MTPLRKCRIAVACIIAGLVVSGLTAFPLLWELEILSSFVAEAGDRDPANHTGFAHWILKVREGLANTDADYPFIAYGTDWLAFGHFVIALFFLPVYRDPVRYRGNIKVALVACLLVFPLALICGPIRGIPLYWQLIDCSFGALCTIPVLLLIKWTAEPHR